MEHHAGLDVSLEETSVCIVDGAGKIIRETQVASEPEALVGYFFGAGDQGRVHWAGGRAFIAVVARCIDGSWLRGRPSRDAACEGSFIGNDGQNRPPRCARAQLLRMGWYRPVHCKTLPSQEVRAIITARKTLLGKL